MNIRENIIETLCSNGFAAFVVGGAVRDMFVGLDAKDEDVVTNATPDQLEILFKDAAIQTVGKTFGVTIIDGIEVATFRADQHAGIVDKNCEVTFVDTIEEDLARRDLTINALAFCQFSGDIIDPFDGRKDLTNKIIRFVGNAEDRIHEDPNRIIRACRFLAKIEGRFAKDTLLALKKNSILVRDNVAKERIRIEILKALELPKPSLFFTALANIGALEHIFPALNDCVDHEHGQHHTEDVFTHMMVAGDSASKKDVILRLAVFLHDIGKPAAFVKNNGENFVSHEAIGADIAEKALTDLKFANCEIDRIVNHIRLHMNGGFLTNDEFNFRALRKLLVRLDAHNIKFADFLRLKVADRVGNLRKKNFNFATILGVVRRRKELNVEEFAIRNLAVSGHDVMELLNILPGPEVGRVLKTLFEFVVDEGFEFNTREILINKIKGAT